MILPLLRWWLGSFILVSFFFEACCYVSIDSD